MTTTERTKQDIRRDAARNIMQDTAEWCKDLREESAALPPAERALIEQIITHRISVAQAMDESNGQNVSTAVDRFKQYKQAVKAAAEDIISDKGIHLLQRHGEKLTAGTSEAGDIARKIIAIKAEAIDNGITIPAAAAIVVDARQLRDEQAATHLYDVLRNHQFAETASRKEEVTLFAFFSGKMKKAMTTLITHADQEGMHDAWYFVGHNKEHFASLGLTVPNNFNPSEGLIARDDDFGMATTEPAPEIEKPSFEKPLAMKEDTSSVIKNERSPVVGGIGHECITEATFQGTPTSTTTPAPSIPLVAEDWCAPFVDVIGHESITEVTFQGMPTSTTTPTPSIPLVAEDWCAPFVDVIGHECITEATFQGMPTSTAIPAPITEQVPLIEAHQVAEPTEDAGFFRTIGDALSTAFGGITRSVTGALTVPSVMEVAPDPVEKSEAVAEQREAHRMTQADFFALTKKPDAPAHLNALAHTTPNEAPVLEASAKVRTALVVLPQRQAPVSEESTQDAGFFRTIGNALSTAFGGIARSVTGALTVPSCIEPPMATVTPIRAATGQKPTQNNTPQQYAAMR